MQEDSESEEEILVYAEFEESVNIDKYRAIHVLGVNDKKPIIQLDETFFIGKYENALGTYMFFENDTSIQGKDPLFDKYPDKGVKYVCKTQKTLNMEHAYVTPKEDKESNAENQTKPIEEDVYPITFRDLHQAIEAFKPYFNSGIKSSDNLYPDNKDRDKELIRQIDNIIKESNVGSVENISIESTSAQNSNEVMIKYIAEENSDNGIVESTLEQNTHIESDPMDTI